MAFSSVLGASSVIKPGVVTTATRPSSPFVGQLIYDTTVSQTLVWNGSAWIVQTGGLVYITGTTFSAASTVSLPASTFSTTYSNYKIMFDITAASVNNEPLRARLRIAGADNTTSNYVNTAIGALASADTICYSRIDFGTAFIFGYLNSIDMNALTLDLISPFVAQATKVFSAAMGRNSGGGVAPHVGGGAFNAATSFDALSVYPSSGTITGSYKVYGYANA